MRDVITCVPGLYQFNNEVKYSLSIVRGSRFNIELLQMIIYHISNDKDISISLHSLGVKHGPNRISLHCTLTDYQEHKMMYTHAFDTGAHLLEWCLK